jgi:hypothetical protein
MKSTEYLLQEICFVIKLGIIFMTNLNFQIVLQKGKHLKKPQNSIDIDHPRHLILQIKLETQ